MGCTSSMENSPTCWQEGERNLDAALAPYVLKLNQLLIWILPTCLFTQHLPVGCSFLKSLCSWMTCCKLLCGLWRCSILVIQAVLPVCYWSCGSFSSLTEWAKQAKIFCWILTGSYLKTFCRICRVKDLLAFAHLHWFNVTTEVLVENLPGVCVHSSTNLFQRGPAETCLQYSWAIVPIYQHENLPQLPFAVMYLKLTQAVIQNPWDSENLC